MKEEKTDPNAKPASLPAPSAPADPHLEEIKDLAARHGKTTMLAVAVVLVVAVPIFLVRYHRSTAEAKAASLLASAEQPSDLERISKDYRDTPTAPLAMITLARALYDNQDFAKALATYEDFLSRHPQHKLAPAAEMGKLHCMEGVGRVEDALKGFDAFASNHKDHFLATQAILAKARCLHHLQRTKDAKIVLEDFVTANPRSRWKARAEEMLEELKRPPVTAAPKPESLIPPAGTNVPLPTLLPPLMGN